MAKNTALSELRVLRKAEDVPALRLLVRARGQELAEEAGIQQGQLRELYEAPERDVVQGAEKVLELARYRARKNKRLQGQARADEAQRQLQRSVRWKEEQAHLDLHVVLTELLATPAKYIQFETDGRQVMVEVARLRKLRRLARCLSGLHVYLTRDALCFRWNGGRGGLNMRCLRPHVRRAEDVFMVAIERPQRQLQQPRRPTLLGDILTDLLTSFAP